MIESVWNFYKRGMRGFGRRLFATTHPYLSGVLSYAICHYATTRSPVKFSNFTPTFVTYDTVVFGFTATAVALAIAIPSVTFLAFLSNEKNGRTAFRDFLFVLAWNGVVHIVAFFVLLPSVILGDNWILSKDCRRAYRTCPASNLERGAPVMQARRNQESPEKSGPNVLESFFRNLDS